MSREEMGFGARFWGVLCGFEFLMLFIFALSVTFLVLIVLSYAYIGTDRTGAVMLQLSLAFLAVVLPSVTYCIYHCRKRERR